MTRPATHEPSAASAAAELATRIDRVAGGVAHWTPATWSAPAPGASGRTRADALHDLVRRLADLAADAECLPRHPVPRLVNDLALPDQLRVVAADLLAADPSPDTLAAAATAASSTHHALWP